MTFTKPSAALSRYPWLALNDYVRVKMKLLHLPLVEAQRHFYERDKANYSFYRFMIDEHPNMRFPDKNAEVRARDTDWLALFGSRRRCRCECQILW